MKIKLDGRTVSVDRKSYCKAKCKQLQEFGYPSLTPEDVEEQIVALENGKKFGDGLTVIGGFMKDEIIKFDDATF